MRKLRKHLTKISGKKATDLTPKLPFKKGEDDEPYSFHDNSSESVVAYFCFN